MGIDVTDLLSRVWNEQALLDAWHVVRERALEDGDAGPDIESFERDVATRLARLSDELRDGTWQPAPVYHLAIPKRSGGLRHLGIPRVEDRVVERSVLAVLDPLIDPLLMP